MEAGAELVVEEAEAVEVLLQGRKPEERLKSKGTKRSAVGEVGEASAAARHPTCDRS